MIAPYRKSVTSEATTRMAAPAVGRPWAGLIVAIACFGLPVMGTAQAIDIPPLPVVPSNIAAANPALVQQRDKLLKERKTLLDRTNSHNQVCSAVEVGSAAEASCTKAYPALEQAINSHIQVSKQYNDNYLAAVNHAASVKPTLPPPAGHPGVAVAPNVASGLPKALDDAIAGAYSSAPPGISDRVRKGFQAVMERDWEVAKAWFQDALNRDPDNARLKRLVALADSPQQPNQRGRPDAKGAGALPINPPPAPKTGTQLQVFDPDESLHIMFPGLKAMREKEALDYLFGFDPYPPASKSGKAP